VPVATSPPSQYIVPSLDPLHSLLRIQSRKMELTLGSETSNHFNQTPGLYPKENTLHQQHGECLTTVNSCNKSANGVFREAVHGLYRDVLYF
jgi:hypothetical protein